MPLGGFSPELVKRADQADKIRGGDGFLVHEDHAAVVAARLGPYFEQGRNSFPVVGDEGQSLGRRFVEKLLVGLTHATALLPLGQMMNGDGSVAATETRGHGGWNLLVEEKFQHVTASRRARGR